MTRRMTGQLRRRTTRLLLLRLLQRSVAGSSGRRGQKTVLVLENGQWLDDESWGLLLLVTRQVKPLLTVVVTRPLGEQSQNAPLSGSCQQLINEGGVQWLRLEELSTTQLMAVIGQALHFEKLPEVALATLTRRAGGNPYLALELTRSWQDTGLLQIADHNAFLTVDATALESAPAPDPAQMAITSRLERLTPPQQLVLKSASVLGTTFALSDLVEVYPIRNEVESLPKHLDSIVQLGLLVRSGDSSEPGYAFKYGLIQEVAHSLLLFSQRRQLKERSRNSL